MRRLDEIKTRNKTILKLQSRRINRPDLNKLEGASLSTTITEYGWNKFHVYFYLKKTLESSSCYLPSLSKVKVQFGCTGTHFRFIYFFAPRDYVVRRVKDLHNRRMSHCKTVRWLSILFLTYQTWFCLGWYNWKLYVTYWVFDYESSFPIFLPAGYCVKPYIFNSTRLNKVVLCVLRDFPLPFLTHRYSAHYYCLLVGDNNSRQTVALTSRPWTSCCILKVSTFSLVVVRRQATYIFINYFYCK